MASKHSSEFLALCSVALGLRKIVHEVEIALGELGNVKQCHDSTQELTHTLGMLIQATEHLLNHYGYDAPGHEAYRDAVTAGREWLAELNNLQALNKG